jgi:hypothetical protein
MDVKLTFLHHRKVDTPYWLVEFTCGQDYQNSLQYIKECIGGSAEVSKERFSVIKSSIVSRGDDSQGCRFVARVRLDSDAMMIQLRWRRP